MTDAPKCKKCGSEMYTVHRNRKDRAYPAFWDCPLDRKDCRIKELERELTKHHKASVRHVAELQSERDAALKARDEAADRVVMLREVLQAVSDYFDEEDALYLHIKPALSNTSALAAQRKREIQSEEESG